MLFGAACASSSDDSGSSAGSGGNADTSMEDDTMSSDSGDSAEAASVDTPAATLTRDLTHLLQLHEYNAAIALSEAVKAEGDLKDPTVMAAVQALDDNTVALSKAIESFYGPEAGKQFLDLWRAHIGFFVDYTLASATGDKAAAKKAEKDLDGYRADFGALIEGATEGELSQDAVAEALDVHVKSTIDVIDSLVAGKTDVFDKLQIAAGHLPGVATALAGGIAAQQDLEGSADDGASTLQRDLTALLDGHEYFAGIALYEAVQAKGDLKDPVVAAAVQALDDNSVSLSKAIESVYGPEAGKKFLDLWRAHIGFFVDYTLASATGDEMAAKKAEKDLDGYRADFGALMEGATEGGLSQDAVADVLDVHVKSTIAAIDSIIAADGKAFDKLQTAANHLPGVATAISGAIVEQFPEKF
jgi:hypothetical protein